MTTTITVKALHGWPVDVTPININENGDWEEEKTERVEPNETRDFSVWNNHDLHIHEVQPNEEK